MMILTITVYLCHAILVVVHGTDCKFSLNKHLCPKERIKEKKNIYIYKIKWVPDISKVCRTVHGGETRI